MTPTNEYFRGQLHAAFWNGFWSGIAVSVIAALFSITFAFGAW